MILFAQVHRHSLMVELCQHAIPKTRLWVVGITRFIRFRVMYMVRYHVNFFGQGFNNKVLCNKTPKRVAKGVGLVRAIPVKPNGAVRTHHHHGINNNGNEQVPAKKFENKKKKEW